MVFLDGASAGQFGEEHALLAVAGVLHSRAAVQFVGVVAALGADEHVVVHVFGLSWLEF